jgi:hypothetical protein
MVYSTPFLWVYQIINILELYLSKENQLPTYKKGFQEIQKTLEKTFQKLQHQYYKYVLEPELQYYIDNTRNSD